MTRYIHPESSRHTQSIWLCSLVVGTCCSLSRRQVAVCVMTLLQTGFSMSHTDDGVSGINCNRNPVVLLLHTDMLLGSI